jgi:hypothetical protein
MSRVRVPSPAVCSCRLKSAASPSAHRGLDDREADDIAIKQRDFDQDAETARLQFSLATLLITIAVAALATASVTELPEWLGAPLLALITTATTALVLNAAVRSKGYALCFYLGAALPLCILAIRTALVMAALANGLLEVQGAASGPRMMQWYTENHLGQRLSYRWEAVSALACAPLIGLICVAARWLGDKPRRLREVHVARRGGRRWVVALLTGLVVLAVVATSTMSIRSLRLVLPPDPSWDSHDGTPVLPSGKVMTTSTELAKGDKVLVEQGGAWWRARIKQVIAGGALIHYVGWESQWDETVPLTRLQLP